MFNTHTATQPLLLSLWAKVFQHGVSPTLVLVIPPSRVQCSACRGDLPPPARLIFMWLEQDTDVCMGVGGLLSANPQPVSLSSMDSEKSVRNLHRRMQDDSPNSRGFSDIHLTHILEPGQCFSDD